MKGDASGEALRRLSKQGGRRAAQHQESGGQRTPVGENPQSGKDVREMLDLVEDDEPPQVSERELGVGEEGPVGRPLEVEVGPIATEPAGDLPGQGRLADLSGPEQRDHGEAPKAAFQGLQVTGPGNPHTSIIERAPLSFQGMAGAAERPLALGACGRSGSAWIGCC